MSRPCTVVRMNKAQLDNYYAIHIAKHCPTATIFILCVNGLSHNEAEDARHRCAAACHAGSVTERGMALCPTRQ